jgi:hypothetical protein
MASTWIQQTLDGSQPSIPKTALAILCEVNKFKTIKTGMPFSRIV